MASEIRVNSFTNRSGLSTVSLSDTGAVISGIVTATNFSGKLNNNNYPSAGPLSNRNLIINGAMQVAQRATQVTSVTTSDYHTCDRFKLVVATLGTWTVDQDTNAPDGFSNSFKLTCTAADASPAANDNLMFKQTIEAQNLQSLAFGTTGAQSITLSFWVRSNKTGDASFAILQNDNSNKLASFQYSISSADTWEQKTITIPADTAGVINNDNGEGLTLEWWLNSGSTFTGGSHQATWSTFSNANRNVSNFGLGGATSDYWQITGVQLEVGETATPFEHRSYGDELRLCERYCQDFPGGRIAVGNWASGTVAYCSTALRTTMRATPSMFSYTAGKVLVENVSWYAATTVALLESTNTHVTFYITGITNSSQSANANAVWGDGAAAVIQAEL